MILNVKMLEKRLYLKNEGKFSYDWIIVFAKQQWVFLISWSAKIMNIFGILKSPDFQQ